MHVVLLLIKLLLYFVYNRITCILILSILPWFLCNISGSPCDLYEFHNVRAHSHKLSILSENRTHKNFTRRTSNKEEWNFTRRTSKYDKFNTGWTKSEQTAVWQRILKIIYQQRDLYKLIGAIECNYLLILMLRWLIR